MNDETLLSVAEDDRSVNLNWGETAPFLLGVEWCANWLTAIVGMFEAIRQNAPRLVERRYWETNPAFYDCFCPGCGVLMKGRRAHADEGTDNEWCGSCRY